MWRTARPAAPTLQARRGKASATHQLAAGPDRRPLLAGGVLCLAGVAPLPAGSQTPASAKTETARPSRLTASHQSAAEPFRSRRIEGVTGTHACALVGMFTRKLECGLEIMMIGDSATLFVTRPRRAPSQHAGPAGDTRCHGVLISDTRPALLPDDRFRPGISSVHRLRRGGQPGACWLASSALVASGQRARRALQFRRVRNREVRIEHSQVEGEHLRMA